MRDLRIVHPDPAQQVVHKLPTSADEPYLSVAEVAQALRLSETTVRRYIRDHGEHLTVLRKGRKVQIAVSSIPVFDRIKTLRRRQGSDDVNAGLSGKGQALAAAGSTGLPATGTDDASAALLAEMSREIVRLNKESEENNKVMRQSMASLVFMINKCNNDIKTLAGKDRTSKRDHDELLERLERTIARLELPLVQEAESPAAIAQEQSANTDETAQDHDGLSDSPAPPQEPSTVQEEETETAVSILQEHAASRDEPAQDHDELPDTLETSEEPPTVQEDETETATTTLQEHSASTDEPVQDQDDELPDFLETPQEPPTAQEEETETAATILQEHAAGTNEPVKRDYGALIRRLEQTVTRQEPPIVEEAETVTTSLHEHLAEEINTRFEDATEHRIATALLGMLDESGYLSGDLGATAMQLGVTVETVEPVLARLQALDPPGVFARDLAECLAVQLHRRARLNPAMRALINNLDLLATQDLAALKRLCGVNDKKLITMVSQIHALNPKPGAAFQSDDAPKVHLTDLVGASEELRELYAEGRHLQALPIAQKELAAAEQEFGRDHPTTVQIQDNLAAIYEALDKCGGYLHEGSRPEPS